MSATPRLPFRSRAAALSVAYGLSDHRFRRRRTMLSRYSYPWWWEGSAVRVLCVGAGGVGSAAVGIAARRPFFDAWVVADYDLARAERGVAAARDPRFSATRVDASDAEAVAH